MLADHARRFGLVIVAGLIIAACGRAPGLTIHAKDGGAVLPDLQSARDLPADGNPVYKDAAADAGIVTADTGPEGPDLGRDSVSPDTVDNKRDAGPDTSPDITGIRNDAGPDTADVGRDGMPDAPIIDKDAGPDGNTVQKDAAFESVVRDLAVDGGGPLTCTGAPVLGTLLPLAQTGDGPRSLALGDLNGDGKLDVVTANYDSSTVSVLLGTGNGTFAAKVDYATGSSPEAVVLGDLNGDGKPDLVTANWSSSNVSVLLGTGNGTFAAKVDYPSGDGTYGTYSVAIGDLNGDGKLDIVAANSNLDAPSTVSVLLGTGNGKFAANVDYPTGYGAFSVALGDLNGDGKLDLVTGGFGTVSVLLGTGDGRFAANVDYPFGSIGDADIEVVLGDLNGDGRLDLVAATFNSDTVSAWLGTGDGAFAAGVDFQTEEDLALMALDDLDGDGKLDLVTANYRSNTVSVLLGTGDGKFAAKVDYPGRGFPSSVALGDFNADGKLDLAIVNHYQQGLMGSDSNFVSVLLGKGDGKFATGADYPTGGQSTSVSLVDLNGDGKLDLATANRDSNTVSVLLGTGDGKFAAKQDYDTGSAPYSMALGDLNGDSKLDIVAGNYSSNTVSVLLGTGDGKFAAKQDYPIGVYPHSVALGDLNGDSELDIVTGNYGSNTVSVLLGTGDGKFAAKQDYPAGTCPESVALGDLNGDGKLDLIVAGIYSGSSTMVSVLLGTGDGQFAAKVEYPTGGQVNDLFYPPYPESFALGDLNGDGKLDLVAANWSSSSVSVLLGRGDGTFSAKVDYPSLPFPESVALGDLNGDGKLDLVTLNETTGTVSMLLGTGDGTFAAKVDYVAVPGAIYSNPPGYTGASLALGDLNGDGKLDLVAASNNGASVSVLLSSCR